jgi:hypothetical protein
MNRRDFFKSLGVAALAPLIPTVAELLPQPGVTRYVYQTIGIGFAIADDEVSDTEIAKIGSSYASHLARSVVETKETLSANILNRAFETDSMAYRVHEKYRRAYENWRGVFGSVGA